MTSPQVKPDADRLGYTRDIEGAGGTVLSGMCFYQSYAREIAEANGWKRYGKQRHGQHFRRLWIPTDAGVDGSLRRRCGERQIGMTNE